MSTLHVDCFIDFKREDEPELSDSMDLKTMWSSTVVVVVDGSLHMIGERVLSQCITSMVSEFIELLLSYL